MGNLNTGSGAVDTQLANNAYDNPLGALASMGKGANIGLVCTLVLMASMGVLTDQMGTTVARGQTDNKVQNDILNLSTDISNLQTNSGVINPAGPCYQGMYDEGLPGPLAAMEKQLATDWKQLYGNTTFNADGTVATVDPNSDFGQMVSMLKQQDGANYTTDPRYQEPLGLASAFVTTQISDPNQSGGYTGATLYSDITDYNNSNGQTHGTFDNDIDALCGNHYMYNNAIGSAPKPTTDWLGTFYSDDSAAQAPFTTQSQEDSAFLSQGAATMNSLQGIGQQMITSETSMITQVVQNTAA